MKSIHLDENIILYLSDINWTTWVSGFFFEAGEQKASENYIIKAIHVVAHNIK